MLKLPMRYAFLLYLIIAQPSNAMIPTHIPYNYQQQHSACWMFATLQCLYRLDRLRESLNLYLEKAPVKDTYDYKFLKILNDAFSSMQTQSHQFPKELYDSVFNLKFHEHLGSLPTLKKWSQGISKWESLSNEKLGQYSHIVDFSGEFFDEFESPKQGLFNDPAHFMKFIVAALLSMPSKEFRKDLIFYAPGDMIPATEIEQRFNPKKEINIISLDPNLQGGAAAIPEEIDNSELVALTLAKPNFHHKALIKYNNSWYSYDSFAGNTIQGQTLSKSLHPILTDFQKTGFVPRLLFYQISPLKKKLKNLSNALTELKKRLSTLKEHLDQLKQQLFLKS